MATQPSQRRKIRQRPAVALEGLEGKNGLCMCIVARLPGTVQADKAMELSVAIQAGLAEPPRLAMPGKDPEGKVVRRTAKSAIGELRPCQGVPRILGSSRKVGCWQARRRRLVVRFHRESESEFHKELLVVVVLALFTSPMLRFALSEFR